MRNGRPSLREAMFGRINEDAAVAKDMAKKLDSMLSGGESNYGQFVSTLKKAISDPDFKKMIKSGGEEDIIKVDNASTGVKGLTPVQKEIGVKNSLGYIAGNPGKRSDTLEAAKAGAGGEALKIVTLNGTHIVDGHHRWSQLYMLNPNATIMSYDMKIPLNDPADAMKVAQIAIAAKVDSVPSSEGDTATDIFGALKSDSALKKYFEDPMYNDLLNEIASKGLVNQSTGEAVTNKEQAIQMLVDHCAMLKSRGTATNISRFEMPQFDPKVGGPEFPQIQGDLTSGGVNWKGIAGESRNSGDDIILERWQKLAGILRG